MTPINLHRQRNRGIAFQRIEASQSSCIGEWMNEKNRRRRMGKYVGAVNDRHEHTCTRTHSHACNLIRLAFPLRLCFIQFSGGCFNLLHNPTAIGIVVFNSSATRTHTHRHKQPQVNNTHTHTHTGELYWVDMWKLHAANWPQAAWLDYNCDSVRTCSMLVACPSAIRLIIEPINTGYEQGIKGIYWVFAAEARSFPCSTLPPRG